MLSLHGLQKSASLSFHVLDGILQLSVVPALFSRRALTKRLVSATSTPRFVFSTANFFRPPSSNAFSAQSIMCCAALLKMACWSCCWCSLQACLSTSTCCSACSLTSLFHCCFSAWVTMSKKTWPSPWMSATVILAWRSYLFQLACALLGRER